MTAQREGERAIGDKKREPMSVQESAVLFLFARVYKKRENDDFVALLYSAHLVHNRIIGTLQVCRYARASFCPISTMT